MNMLRFWCGNPDLNTKNKRLVSQWVKAPNPSVPTPVLGVAFSKKEYLNSQSEWKLHLWKHFSLRLHAGYVILDQTPTTHITVQPCTEKLAPITRKLHIFHLLNDHQGTVRKSSAFLGFFCVVFFADKNIIKTCFIKMFIVQIQYNALNFTNSALLGILTPAGTGR